MQMVEVEFHKTGNYTSIRQAVSTEQHSRGLLISPVETPHHRNSKVTHASITKHSVPMCDLYPCPWTGVQSISKLAGGAGLVHRTYIYLFCEGEGLNKEGLGEVKPTVRPRTAGAGA